MRRQAKILNNAGGNDTHVRDFQDDMFRTSSSQTYQIVSGEIAITQPEPLFKQNYVTVNLARGGTETTVAYPGAFIDPITGNLHGAYEGPIPGQMVMMGYQDGNSKDPFIVNRYPYQGKGNSFSETSYITPLTKAQFDATDVIIGHFSGSYLSFNTGILSGKLPGSVNLYSMTNFTSECLLGTSFSQDLGFTMESSLGTSFIMDALFEIKNAATSLKTLKDDLFSLLDNFTVAGSAVTQTTSAAQKLLNAAESAKWDLLFK